MQVECTSRTSLQPGRCQSGPDGDRPKQHGQPGGVVRHRATVRLTVLPQSSNEVSDRSRGRVGASGRGRRRAGTRVAFSDGHFSGGDVDHVAGRDGGSRTGRGFRLADGRTGGGAKEAAGDEHHDTGDRDDGGREEPSDHGSSDDEEGENCLQNAHGSKTRRGQESCEGNSAAKPARKASGSTV